MTNDLDKRLHREYREIQRADRGGVYVASMVLAAVLAVLAVVVMCVVAYPIMEMTK